MRPENTSSAAADTSQSDNQVVWQILLWLIFAANALFFLPQCLDRSLAPRFFFLSLVLIAGFWLLRRQLMARSDGRTHLLDLLLSAWLVLHLASVTWAFSGSEAIFYAQKVFLWLAVYWLLRRALALDASLVRRTLRHATTALTALVCGTLLIQLALSAAQHGLSNDRLYQLDWFFFGNKGLTADFLFFLLVFNLMFAAQPGSDDTDARFSRLQKFTFRISLVLLPVLILLLQTRTVYLALVAGAAVYFVGRALMDSGFWKDFRKKILPAGLVTGVLMITFLAFTDGGRAVTGRLNPLHYLDSETANERRFVWYKTDLLNADHFWWGVGSGNWKFWFPSKNLQGGYRLQEQNVVFTRAHNDYLEVRSELGMVGVTLFLALFGAALLVAFSGIRNRATEPAMRLELLAVAAGLIGYCIIQYFDFPRERIETQVVLAVWFAFIAFRTPGWTVAKPTWVGANSRILVFGLLLAGLLFNLVIGYYRVAGEMHTLRMQQYQSKHQYQRMIAEAQAAENLFYKYNDVAVPLAWYEGVGYYQLNQTEPAVRAFERAWRLHPWSFQVINNYASALVKAGRFREAVPLYEKAVEINPRYEDGKFNLAYTWYQAGDLPKAMAWINRMDTIPNPKTEDDFRKNAYARQRQNELRQAVEMLQRPKPQ